MIPILLLALASVAQGAPGSSLRGSVRDQTGAVLQGARIELVDDSGAVVRTGVTDARGDYALDNVAPGTYHLKIQFEGFSPATVRIRVDPRRTVTPQTVVLQLASVPQEITVSDDEALRAAASANRDAIVLDDKALGDLPIFDRDIVGTLSRMLDAAALGTGGVTLVVDGMEARKVGVSPSAIKTKFRMMAPFRTILHDWR
ncbi:MAG TPA: carboxypeptidase-like regulatory domain-containing protein [Vicinamibacterales bacterium]|jgi:hypothetical protein|nr:carboxypeptidase-like regulatory domain-containing protein [Vicinamibacterales bacterium]